jgi:hypothetical protein
MKETSMSEAQTSKHNVVHSVIGLRVDPEADGPNFYLILINEGDSSLPFLVDEQLAIFLSHSAAMLAIHEAGGSEANVEFMPDGLDFAAGLYLLQSEVIDPSATILNLLNVLSDVFIGTRISVPSEYKPILNELVRHLTFEREFGKFVEQIHITREACINGTLWCLGAVFANSRIIN